MILATFLNDKLPKRLRLSEGDFYRRELKYKLMKKRELLKLAPKRWRALGLHVRRGWIFPTFNEYLARLFRHYPEAKDCIRKIEEEERCASMKTSAG